MGFGKANSAVTPRTSGVSDFSEIPVSKIYPNSEQPRKTFEDIEGLAVSIQRHGLLQPITVVKKDDGYMIVAGERRYRATKYLNKPTIKCYIKDMTDSELAEATLIENIQREDLSDYEKAKYIQKLWDSGNYSQKQELAHSLGKSSSYISNALSILKLDDDAKELIEHSDKSIPMSVMSEVSKLPQEIQKETIKEYQEGNITREDIRDKKKDSDDSKDIEEDYYMELPVCRLDLMSISDMLSQLVYNSYKNNSYEYEGIQYKHSDNTNYTKLDVFNRVSKIYDDMSKFLVYISIESGKGVAHHSELEKRPNTTLIDIPIVLNVSKNSLKSILCQSVQTLTLINYFNDTFLNMGHQDKKGIYTIRIEFCVKDELMTKPQVEQSIDTPTSPKPQKISPAKIEIDFEENFLIKEMNITDIVTCCQNMDKSIANLEAVDENKKYRARLVIEEIKQ